MFPRLGFTGPVVTGPAFPRHLRAVLALLLLVAGLLPVTGPAAMAAEPVPLRSDGLDRRYVLYRPGSAPSEGALPLVLLLHDADADAMHALDHYGWKGAAESHGFLVASLEATPADPGSPAQYLRNPLVWSDGSGAATDRPPVDDVAYVGDVLAHLSARGRIDPERVFAAGFGHGGAMVQRLAVELSDRIAGFASVGGHLRVSGTLRRARPVYLLFGAQDPLAPAAGGAVPSPFSSGARVPSIGGVVAAWRTALDCPSAPSSEAEAARLRRTVWAGCRDDAFLVFTLVTDLGHQWPGAGPGPLPRRIVGPTSSAIPGAEDIWTFFRSAAEIESTEHGTN